jgi:hypothetical protein
MQPKPGLTHSPLGDCKTAVLLWRHRCTHIFYSASENVTLDHSQCCCQST